MSFLISPAIVLLFGITSLYGQTVDKGSVSSIRGSAAFAEVLLRKTEVEAEIESVTADYTETNPKMMDLRFELGSLNRAVDRLYAVPPSEIGRLSLALGKLMVKRAALDTDLARLRRTYTEDKPEVKRAKRKVDLFEDAINDILRTDPGKK